MSESHEKQTSESGSLTDANEGLGPPLYKRAHFTRDKVALIVGLGAFLTVIGFGYLSLELVYGEANTREIAAAMRHTSLYFGGALITASITIVALMVNALGMARKIDADFDEEMYLRIYRITAYATALLGTATMLMLMLFLPLEEFSGVPKRWYDVYYHALVVHIAVATGVVASTGAELYRTTHGLLQRVLNDMQSKPEGDEPNG